MNKDLSYFPFNITQFLRCTKSIWLPSGQLMKLIYTKIWEIGKNSIKKNDTSLNMCWHFLRQVMESFLKTWLNSFAHRSRSLKQGVSTVFKLLWKTFTLKHILFLLTLTLRMYKKNNIFLMRFLTLRLSSKRQTGLWSGWTKLILSKKD